MVTRPRSFWPSTTGRAGGRKMWSSFSPISATSTSILNDQTLRLLNQGYTGIEIAEMLAAGEPEPAMVHPRLLRHPEPQRQGHLPALYRLVRRQSRQPHALPPEEAAAKFVEYMGGADAVMAQAREDYGGRLSLGGPGHEPGRLCRSRQRGGAQPGGRRPRAARLPGGGGHLAQLVSAGRLRAAQRHSALPGTGGSDSPIR